MRLLVAFFGCATLLMLSESKGDEPEEQAASERCYNLHANVANWKLRNCSPTPTTTSGDGETHLVVPGKQFWWPNQNQVNGLCIGYDEEAFVGASTYALTLSFKKHGSFDKGHPGVIYNYVNDKNYDYVHLRTFDKRSVCASLIHGRITYTGHFQYNEGGYEEGKWNYLKVEVSDASSYSLVTLNGRGVARCHMRHTKSAKGGILVLNNYFQEAYSFRDFNIEVLATPAMLNTTAIANIKGSVSGRNPWDTYNRFCRTTSGVRCHFPFNYQNGNHRNRYYSCTLRYRNRRWCGTTSNVGSWGYCAPIGC